MGGLLAASLKVLVDVLDNFGLIYKRDVAVSFNCKRDRGKEIAFLPPTPHVTISSSLLEGKRVLFVGDVHGCLDELRELYRKCTTPVQETILVFVGDLVMKGPKTAEVIRFARETGSFSVRGNHEQSMLTDIENKRNNQPVREKCNCVYDLTEEDENFLENLPFSISIPFLNVIVVHGGLFPGVPLENQDPMCMMFIRNYNPENFCGSSKLEDGFPWAATWDGPQHVVFGHDARRGLQLYHHATGIDTGCVYGNYLTGILVEDGVWENRKIVHVKAKQQYTAKTNN
ncbi:Bis(5'-nucleosyl)-tetraphosphatase PrpE [asymmetrical] [Acropora cervicornis]|uniref:Bis(5'-nucleosyl)-tetraphosphatase PrpE [asymmetrical] n=1 Tax=Acropora cervicornis TaxID=6130 RepID=A0AAD9R7I6_ACRCE|nr:Bis(5'-nucleosyl)-tetraphosphatase PrpE [asymmetrical] [Acropora cervicornis]